MNFIPTKIFHYLLFDLCRVNELSNIINPKCRALVHVMSRYGYETIYANPNPDTLNKMGKKFLFLRIGQNFAGLWSFSYSV
jgi:hypothetical protein